jgi:preprotein translocase subunit YajC
VFTFIPVAVAYAAGGAKTQGSPIMSMAPLVLLFVVFYFLLIRPQQKKAKVHKEMLSKVEKGDNAITNGGLYGRVTAVAEDTITLEVADNVRVKVARGAIATRTPKGS